MQTDVSAEFESPGILTQSLVIHAHLRVNPADVTKIARDTVLVSEFSIQGQCAGIILQGFGILFHLRIDLPDIPEVGGDAGFVAKFLVQFVPFENIFQGLRIFCLAIVDQPDIAEGIGHFIFAAHRFMDAKGLEVMIDCFWKIREIPIDHTHVVEHFCGIGFIPKFFSQFK